MSQRHRVGAGAAAVRIARRVWIAARREQQLDDLHRVRRRPLPFVFEAVGAEVIEQRAAVGAG